MSQRSVTFSPEALQAVIKQAVELALANQKNNPAPVNTLVNGKTERQLKTEVKTVRAFKKAGFGNVKVHEDVRTFKRWLAIGMRPIEGSKALKVGGFRLFHKTQCRPITMEEKAALQEQNAEAIAHYKGNVTKLPSREVQ